MFFNCKKGHNSYKNKRPALIFELVQGIDGSNLWYKFYENLLRIVGVRVLTTSKCTFFNCRKGHNSIKNYCSALIFELARGIHNSNIWYKFYGNPLRIVGVSVLTRFKCRFLTVKRGITLTKIIDRH